RRSAAMSGARWQKLPPARPRPRQRPGSAPPDTLPAVHNSPERRVPPPGGPDRPSTAALFHDWADFDSAVFRTRAAVRPFDRLLDRWHVDKEIPGQLLARVRIGAVEHIGLAGAG